MTQVRRLMWGALAVASAAMVAVVTEATRTTTPSQPATRPAVVAAPMPARDAKPIAAVADATAPAIVDYAAPKVGPNEPAIEIGSSTLALRLRDADTAAPVDAKFVLWRLGVAADEFWSAGDQAYSESSTVGGVVHIARLPEGRYRIFCDDQRKGAEDPPEFVVGAGVNEVERTIRAIRSFHLRVLVVDDAGAPVASGSLRNMGGGGRYGLGWIPAWATTRTPLWPGALGRGGGGDTFRDFHGKRTGSPVRSVAGVFDLATFRESSRTDLDDYSWEFVPSGREPLPFRVDSDSAADSTFVYVAPRNEVLAAHVTSPGGAKLDPAVANIYSQCDPVPCAWPPPADAWRTIPVHVKVIRDGYEPLEFVWTAATADAEHRLVAAPAKSSK